MDTKVPLEGEEKLQDGEGGGDFDETEIGGESNTEAIFIPTQNFTLPQIADLEEKIANTQQKLPKKQHNFSTGTFVLKVCKQCLNYINGQATFCKNCKVRLHKECAEKLPSHDCPFLRRLATEEGKSVQFRYRNAYRAVQLARCAYNTEAEIGDKFEEINEQLTVELFLNDSKTDSQAFIASSNAKRQLIVSFCGTVTMKDIATDLYILMKPFPPDCKNSEVHSGFLRSYMSIRAQVLGCIEELCGKENSRHKGYDVICCGHSLGGALSVLGGIDIRLAFPKPIIGKVIVYPIACPRVGNEHFAHLYHSNIDESWRLANINDVICRLPTWTPLHRYKHVNTLVYFGQKNGIFGYSVDPFKSHPEHRKKEEKKWKSTSINPVNAHTVYLGVYFPRSPEMKINKDSINEVILPPSLSLSPAPNTTGSFSPKPLPVSTSTSLFASASSSSSSSTSSSSSFSSSSSSS
eukprot:TRINITY_DN5889_c0_g1_i3.p1 TRINITY_DN5889_c0_g1~~TRINITY_DN5889_c0_g1_i3.p1  ORF type:complete len:464 (-),score=103.77 TRINITY_DN5889_c0_g1_i3:149-1540(-)